MAPVSSAYISREETVHGERAALTSVICIEYDDNIFDCDDESEGPDDD